MSTISIFYCQSLHLCKRFMVFMRLVIFLLLVALNHIHKWYFCNVCTGPTQRLKKLCPLYLFFLLSVIVSRQTFHGLHEACDFLLLVALNHIHVWYFCDVSTGPTHPISCLPTTPPHNLNFPQPFVIFIISYIFTSLNQSYPCYCSETCTEPTNSNFFVFHVAPGLCHLDYSFSVCKISHKLNFCFIYLFL